MSGKSGMTVCKAVEPAPPDVPITDVNGLLQESIAAGLTAGGHAYISSHLRFSDRASWEQAADAVPDPWQMSAYSRADGFMLRLSRRIRLTAHDIEQERRVMVDFARQTGGVWDSVTVEDLTRWTVWQELASQEAEAVDAATESTAPPLGRIALPSQRALGSESA